MKLKDGSVSRGRKILIDGQQRVTALQAAIAGLEVTDSSYKKKRIKIAFNPQSEEFEVCNSAIEKDSKWIADIAPCVYMENMKKQVAGQGSFYGGIATMEDLQKNLGENCLPVEFMDMDISNFAEFLEKRRRLMAQYIRRYYKSLS